MPTVLRIGGCRVVIYPNDHRPSHVHLVGSDREAVFNLNCPQGPPRLRDNYGFSLAQLNAAAADLTAHLGALCDHWSRIHGDF